MALARDLDLAFLRPWVAGRALAVGARVAKPRLYCGLCGGYNVESTFFHLQEVRDSVRHSTTE